MLSGLSTTLGFRGDMGNMLASAEALRRTNAAEL